jgi:hypothetical protein
MRLPPLLLAALVAGCAPVAPSSSSNADLERLGIDAAEYARVRHSVTARMELEAKAQSSRLAPAFERADPYGKKVAVGKEPMPQMVVFIKKGCPCSIDAQPLFNKLARRYDGKVEFVGVIDKEAKDFSTQFRVAFPVVEEPSLGLMRAFDARASVYCALVARNGHIVKMWPGYSASWLKEMNGLLAKASATPEKPFDPEYAPTEKASGCPFQ